MRTNKTRAYGIGAIAALMCLQAIACGCKPPENSKGKNARTLKAVIQQRPEIPPDTVAAIGLPEDYKRIALPNGSYRAYLRYLPLKPHDSVVHLYNGMPKGNQQAHYAILDIDAGTRDLQQCADAAMRLWGEYLYSKGRFSDIHFNFLSDGKPRYFVHYSDKRDYETFRKYMDYMLFLACFS